jgi:hypothetical protein
MVRRVARRLRAAIACDGAIDGLVVRRLARHCCLETALDDV